MSKADQVREMAAKITKELANRGLLIEGGFRALLLTTGVEATDPIAVKLRHAYFAGAQHLFASILQTLDPGTQETEADIRRLELISQELGHWVEQEQKRNQQKQ